MQRKSKKRTSVSIRCYESRNAGALSKLSNKQGQRQTDFNTRKAHLVVQILNRKCKRYPHSLDHGQGFRSWK